MEAMSSEAARDSSKNVCERIIQANLHADMLTYLGWKTLSVESLNKPNSKAKREFVTSIIMILHNVVRMIDTPRSAFREHKAFDVLQKFRGVTESAVCYVFVLDN